MAPRTRSAAAPVGVEGDDDTGQPWRPAPDRHLSLLFDVFALGQRVRTLVADAMAGCGLRPDEYAAYSVVFESSGITMTAMARELGLPVTTAADYVRAMQARRHLRRDPHPQDSRAYGLTLTAAGLRAHRRASAAFDQAHRALLRELAPLSEEEARAAVQAIAAAAHRAAAPGAATRTRAATRTVGGATRTRGAARTSAAADRAHEA